MEANPRFLLAFAQLLPDAGRNLQQITAQMEDTLLKSGHRRLLERPGELGGFPVTVTIERVLGSMNVILALDRAPGTEIRMSPAEVKGTDPAKLRVTGGFSELRNLTLFVQVTQVTDTWPVDPQVG